MADSDDLKGAAAQMAEAAEHMRAHHGAGHPRHLFWMDLAAFIDARGRELAAAERLSQCDEPGSVGHAAEIARSYLKAAR